MNARAARLDREIVEIARVMDLIETENKLQLYKPYAKQEVFHNAGKTHRERLLRAGNQQGKTLAGGNEMAFHLTGRYPDWWDGYRFAEPILAWAGSDTGETTRDNSQRALLGPLGEFGSGSIPKECLADMKASRGIAELQDYVKVRHITGGLSTLRFKFYEQGRQKWQGPSVHVVWFDEEPHKSIYDEGMARTIATQGIGYVTFTPLLGMSSVVLRFLHEDSEDRSDTRMEIEDALHIPESQRKKIIASFPAHEREARARGVPTLGSGRIFPIEESLITYDPMMTEISKSAVWIAGLDFGWDHPTAAVKIAWDRDNDKMYLIATYKRREATPLIHSGALRAWGDWLPWAWPHDGLQHDKGSGINLATQYKDLGLKMLRTHATYEDGSNGLEAGVLDMLTRMETGRLVVADHLVEWFEEFRLYHRKEGKIVKELDDLMSATRYAMMCLRKAVVKGGVKLKFNQKREGGGWMG